LQNTGRSPYIGALDNTLKWSYPTSTAFEASPSIGFDRTIYIGGFDGNVYAVNPDGTLKWTYPTGGIIHSSPAIDNEGTIYVGSRGSAGGTFYALNPDGTLKWSQFISQVYSPPTIGPNGTIYVGSRDYKLYAFNPDGTIKWSFPTGGYIYSCPAIGADGTIYFGSYDGNLYALYDNGSLKWSYRIGSYIYASPAIGEDGTIYVGTAPGTATGGGLYAINSDGTFKWSFFGGGTMGRVYSSAAIGSDNTIYVGCDGGSLYALYDNGSLKWSYTTGTSVQSSPAVDKNGDIYIGSGLSMYALHPDGTLKWKFTTGSGVISSPAINVDGVVYFGSLDGNLYAIRGFFVPCEGTASIRLATSGTPPYLWGIRKARVTVNLVVYEGDNLRLRFLKMDNTTVEWENVIWSRTAPGAQTVTLTNLVVPHDNYSPYPSGNIYRMKLVLTDSAGNVILDNMAWYTAVHNDWGSRIQWIILNWALHTGTEQIQLGAEIQQIILNWPDIPSARDQHDFQVP
jgi:outer membrane protein assembly factor BamB